MVVDTRPSINESLIRFASFDRYVKPVLGDLREGLGCSAPLDLDTYVSSNRLSPRGGRHDGKATNVQSGVEGQARAGGANRRQESARHLPRGAAQAAGALKMEGRISGKGARDLCH